MAERPDAGWRAITGTTAAQPETARERCLGGYRLLDADQFINANLV